MKFFRFVMKHYGNFFWLETIYTLAVYLSCIIFETSEWIPGVLMLPLNLIAWPVLFASARDRWKLFRERVSLPYIRGIDHIWFALAIAILSVSAPLMFILRFF